MDLPEYHQCDLGLRETASHAFYNSRQVHQFWGYVGELTARIVPEHLVFLGLACAGDTLSPSFTGSETNSVCHFARSGRNGGVDVSDGGSLAIQTLFSSLSGPILWASAHDKDQI